LTIEILSESYYEAQKTMEYDPAHLNMETISRLKWLGIDETTLSALEDRQRERVRALREILEAEEWELRWIIAARSSQPNEFGDRHGTVYAPIGYSEKMTWKDKIILVIAQAKRPLLAREIVPVLKLWEPKEKHKDIDALVSVLLTKLVRDGALVRIKRKGQSGALHSLPE
jgi:hypothetical protein